MQYFYLITCSRHNRVGLLLQPQQCIITLFFFLLFRRGSMFLHYSSECAFCYLNGSYTKYSRRGPEPQDKCICVHHERTWSSIVKCACWNRNLQQVTGHDTRSMTSLLPYLSQPQPRLNHYDIQHLQIYNQPFTQGPQLEKCIILCRYKLYFIKL